MISIDRLDAELLRRLDENGRIGIAELASQLGVARNTVQARLQRLQDSGIVTGFHATLDLEAAGVLVQAFVGLELDQRRLTDVVRALTEVPEVLEVSTQAGREDLLVRVAAVNHAELQETVFGMLEIPGVRHTTTTMIVFTPLRYRTQPLLDCLTDGAGFGRSTPSPHRP